ncbi:LPS export ABC transporter permease LptG [Jiella sp. M17.18]|uniref:LPS export ABC transporter permease LptG n=1 Tax=Jiella sp. M17.18 TaxID=3234247 RepID=UPI0034DFE30A
MRHWTLNWYLFRSYLRNFVSTMFAISALIYVINMIEVSRRGQLNDFGFGTVALFSALQVPAFVEQALPFIVLFSSIFVLLSLNRRLELVVARAAGVSIWQILMPFLAGSLLIGVFATFVLNPSAAWTTEAALQYNNRLTGESGNNNDPDKFTWLRQNSHGVKSIIGGAAVGGDGFTLRNVSAFVMGDDGKVRERIDAPRAVLGKGHWTLEKPRVTRIGYTPEFPQEYRLPTTLKPQYIQQRIADPQSVPIWDLPSKIGIAQSLGLNAMAFSMQLQTLIARPALFIAMTLLAATVATRFSRTGQSGRTIASGVLAGFMLYVVTFLAKALGSNSIVPPVAAAWFPVLGAGLFGVTVLLHQEDG